MDDRYLFKAKTAKIVGTYNNDVEDGVWVHGSLRCDVGKYTIFQFETARADYAEYEIDPSTICQCIGKRDKYNHLIFENDLMDGFIYPYLSGLDSEHDYFAEVCWCDDITGFGICTHKYKNSDVRGSADGDVNLIEDFDSSKWEVIGNIFDNPELLESEE